MDWGKGELTISSNSGDRQQTSHFINLNHSINQSLMRSVESTSRTSSNRVAGISVQQAVLNFLPLPRTSNMIRLWWRSRRSVHSSRVSSVIDWRVRSFNAKSWPLARSLWNRLSTPSNSTRLSCLSSSLYLHPGLDSIGLPPRSSNYTHRSLRSPIIVSLKVVLGSRVLLLLLGHSVVRSKLL